MKRSATTSSNGPQAKTRPEPNLLDDGEYNIPIDLRQAEEMGIDIDEAERPVTPVGDLQINFDVEYRELSDKDFNNLADVAARKKVIGMIKEKKDLWAFKKVSVPREQWEELAVNHFRRTGNMSQDIHIRKVWGSAKKELLDILTQSIQSKDTEEETEEKLRTWDLYRHMSFYRVVTYEYEVELRKKVKNLPYNHNIVEDLSAFTDLVTSYQEVTEEDRSVHHKLVREAPLILDETDTGTTRKIRAPPRKPELSMTPREYKALEEEQFEDRTDMQTLKLILSVIEMFPVGWTRKRACFRPAHYVRIAIELYLRTELLLSVGYIREVFNETKKKLRMELDLCKRKKLSLKDTELALDKWELYHQIKFYREAMMEIDINGEQSNVAADELLLDEDAPGVDENPQNDDTLDLPDDNNPPAPLFPKIPVPDKIDGLAMTLDEYKKVKNFVKRNDLESTKKIIAVLETHNGIWEHKGRAMPLEKWQNLAVDVYLRTSFLLEVKSIRELWKRAKEQLRGKVRPTLTAKDKKSLDAAMSRLHNWELYEQTKFFRVVMKEYEEETQKKHQGFKYDEELVDAQDPFEDIIFLEEYTSDPQMKEYMLQYPLAGTVEMKPDVGQIENEEEEEGTPEELGKIRIPAPRPGVQMTLDEYKAMGSEEFEDRTDAQAKKWVLCLIEKEPALWCRRKIKTTTEQWQELAIEFYLRTGSSMSVNHIRSIWKNLKDSMRKRLSKPLDSAKIEEELAKWEFYAQMKFFRKVMKEVEDARQKKFDGRAHNEDILNEPTAFDDIFVMKVVKGTGKPVECIKNELDAGVEETEDSGANSQHHDGTVANAHTDNGFEAKPEYLLSSVEQQDDQITEVVNGTEMPPENIKDELSIGVEDFEAHNQDYDIPSANVQFHNTVEAKVEHMLELAKHQEDNQMNIEEYQQNEELVELAPPQNEVQPDHTTEEAMFIVGRLFDLGQEGNIGAREGLKAFMNVISRPGFQDTSRQEFLESFQGALKNQQDDGEGNRPA
ncbi:hypothetical protein CAEBREN_13781 [Caenorhabditis brenneri]|uniref:MADF domain-containing protein n=1 Tax=Caenorhabditis brenneri TaxID=135651 RepID=G0NGK2_CAEBE|nr:hypothetical protein CAEBREN_13781 [Caenorhabditis brenneri]